MFMSWKKNCSILVLLCCCAAAFLAGCSNEKQVAVYDEQPPALEQSVADYYAELGITEEVRKTAPAVVETITVNEEKELQLRLPEYWQQIYSVQTNAVDNCTIINLHEKYNFDRRQAGLLASIDVYDRAYYEQNIMQLSPEVYGQIIGANSIILGTDDAYVYLMWAPTDVQFDYEDELATALYQAGWQAKDKIMADFLEINGITANEEAPPLN